jgi:hypothetical protein
MYIVEKIFTYDTNKNLANDILSEPNFIHRPLWKLTRGDGNGLLSQICRFVLTE